MKYYKDIKVMKCKQLGLKMPQGRRGETGRDGETRRRGGHKAEKLKAFLLFYDWLKI